VLPRNVKHPGGISSYCRSKGLPEPSFHYGKRKFGSVKPMVAVIAPSSVPVSVSRVEKSLPDPEWLAHFVGDFLRGAQ